MALVLTKEVMESWSGLVLLELLSPMAVDWKPHLDLVPSQDGRDSAPQGSRISMVSWDSSTLH